MRTSKNILRILGCGSWTRGFFCLFSGIVVITIFFNLAINVNRSASTIFGGIDLSAVMIKQTPIPRRIVHIDMKGMPPRPGFLIQYLSQLREWGATGILLEWEDMLPYSGDFKVLRSPNAYSPDEVRDLLRTCGEYGLEVIPLVPTFSHLEFLLKHRKFSFLRELSNDVSTVCPLRPKSLATIMALIDQVLSFHTHTSVKSVHLGGGELSEINQCAQCQHSGLMVEDLYLNHMSAVIRYVREQGLEVMMWDDVVRDWDSHYLETLADTGVQLVVWNFSPDLRAPPDILWNMYWNSYEALFKGKIWGASAYKGADAIDGDLVPIQARISNHISWLKLITATRTKLVGMIISGRSRTSHLHPITESLPAGIPSLMICLRILAEGMYIESMKNDTLRVLGIPNVVTPPSAIVAERLQDMSYNFLGGVAYRFAEVMHAIKALQQDVFGDTTSDPLSLSTTPTLHDGRSVTVNGMNAGNTPSTATSTTLAIASRIGDGVRSRFEYGRRKKAMPPTSFVTYTPPSPPPNSRSSRNKNKQPLKQRIASLLEHDTQSTPSSQHLSQQKSSFNLLDQISGHPSAFSSVDNTHPDVQSPQSPPQSPPTSPALALSYFSKLLSSYDLPSSTSSSSLMSTSSSLSSESQTTFASTSSSPSVPSWPSTTSLNGGGIELGHPHAQHQSHFHQALDAALQITHRERPRRVTAADGGEEVEDDGDSTDDVVIAGDGNPATASVPPPTSKRKSRTNYNSFSSIDSADTESDHSSAIDYITSSAIDYITDGHDYEDSSILSAPHRHPTPKSQSFSRAASKSSPKKHKTRLSSFLSSAFSKEPQTRMTTVRVNALVAQSIHDLIREAEYTLPQMFYENDITELISSKLGIDMHEVVQLEIVWPNGGSGRNRFYGSALSFSVLSLLSFLFISFLI